MSLSTTACNGVIVATGHDWTRAVSVTAPTGQTLRQFVDTGVHDTYWQQRVDAPVAKAGTAVTVSVADLTKADRWSYAAVEVLPAG